jgi:cytochrome c oxidase subunit 3
MSDALTLQTGEDDQSLGVDSARLALWIVLATVTMLFAGLTSAYLVREVSSDWEPIPLPPVLWVNTAVLLTTSATLEAGRRWKRNAQWWLLATALLGALFVAGQLIAWRQLVSLGVYLQSNPHASFFYIFTGLHALHLLAGAGLLSWLTWSAWKSPRVVEESRFQVTASYWHFVGGLWIWLFVVLFVL